MKNPVYRLEKSENGFKAYVSFDIDSVNQEVFGEASKKFSEFS